MILSREAATAGVPIAAAASRSVTRSQPTAFAVGYVLAPLRGCSVFLGKEKVVRLRGYPEWPEFSRIRLPKCFTALPAGYRPVPWRLFVRGER